MTVMREYGSEFDYTVNQRVVQNKWTAFRNFHLLRCGRDAVFAAATVLKERGIENVMVPALSCHSMYEGFVHCGLNVTFYPLDTQFNPKLTDGKQSGKHAILFMLYYGVTDLEFVQRLIREHKECISIVDITHSVWDQTVYALQADVLIGSMRKSVGVVNGGIFLSDRFAVQAKQGTNEFTEFRTRGFQIKNSYNETSDPEQKFAYRTLFAEAERSLDRQNGVYCADPESVETMMSVNAEELRRKRFANFKHLARLLAQDDSVKPLCGQLPETAVPFSFPILVEDQLKLQTELARLGVYAPVLWPIDDRAKAACEFSKTVSENMLSLPVDQRYTIEDMNVIYQRLKQALYGE